MRIPIKVPSLPFAAAEAYIGYWRRAHGEVVARNEIIVELRVRDEIITIPAPQAGLLEVPQLPETVNEGAVLCYLKTGLPNLVCDTEQQNLILDNYRPAEITTSMEFELRQKLRKGEGKFGQGFGTGLAAPQARTPQQDQGARMHAASQQGRRFKVNPLLANSSQFSGDFKAAPNAVPSEAELAPQHSLTLGAKPQLGPSAPAPKPM